MTDETVMFQSELAEVEQLLRSGDRDGARVHLTTFDAELTRYMRGEERLLFPVLERFTSLAPGTTARMRGEHRSLRRLVDTLWELLARHDRPRGLEVLGSLRSVLLLHVAKEEWVLDPLVRPSADHA